MANFRQNPFTDADESVFIEAEAASVPGSSPYWVYLDEIPREDAPTSLRIRDAGSATEEVADQDAQIYQGNPSTNYGTQTYMQTGRDGIGAYYRYRSLIKFDLTGLPAAADVVEVLLQVTLNDTTGSSGFPGSRTIGCHQVTATWAEGTVNYGTAPSYNAVAEDTTAVTVAGMYTFDITQLYKDWKNGTKSNYGVILLDGNESDTDTVRQFATTENATSSKHPKLKITETGGTYAEVARQTTPAAGEFACNYERGILNFNSAQAGQSIEIDYWGRGTPVRE